MKLSGAEILIRCLKEQGVDTVFGYPGGCVLDIYDAIYRDGSLRHILTAHEQGAAHAADGYARATGKTGVCIATSGPGATNLVTGIATAYMDSVPLVAITGNVTVSNLGRDLSEGEIKQLETAEESIIDESCYMQVIRKKTAMLLSACAEIGSISAGASGEMVEKCREFGEYLGYCFQIKDDIFDYFKEANIGKPTGNDIREGKVTLPLLHALQTGRREEAEHCLHIINEKDFTTENIDLLIDFAKANGGIEYAEQRMQVYHDKAVEVLMTLPESEAREGLLLLADYIVERRK